MVIFISGKITGDFNYKEKFAKAEEYLKSKGHVVINPTITPLGLNKYEDYIHICYAYIDVAEAMYMLKGWEDSNGSKNCEYPYGMKNNKLIFYEDEVKTNIDNLKEKIRNIPLSKLPKLSKDAPIAYMLEGEEGNPIFIPIYEKEGN